MSEVLSFVGETQVATGVIPARLEGYETVTTPWGEIIENPMVAYRGPEDVEVQPSDDPDAYDPSVTDNESHFSPEDN